MVELEAKESAEAGKLERSEVQVEARGQAERPESRLKRDEDTSAGIATRLHPMDEAIAQNKTDIVQVVGRFKVSRAWKA